MWNAVIVIWLAIAGWIPAVAADCQNWGTLRFPFETMTAEDIRACLSGGANANQRDQNGWTPLHVAVQRTDDPRVIQALLDGRANPNLEDEHGREPLFYLSKYANRIAVIQKLLDGGADPNRSLSLHTAARHNKNIFVIQALLNGGANPNWEDGNGWTPLHVAARFGTLQEIRMLVENGADVNRRNNSGRRPLWYSWYSLKYNSSAADEYLRGKGARK